MYLGVLLNPKFHWLHQIATTFWEFHWRFWIFLDAIAKAKNLIFRIYSTESQASFTDKEFLTLAMAFNLLLSNLTAVAKAKKPHVSETCRDIFSNEQLKVAN